MNGQKILLSAHGVVNRFGKQLVHDGLDIDIAQGEIIGLVGGSGTGKSVLMRTMVGLHMPDEGEVTIAGRNIRDIQPGDTAELFGVLFQQGALFSSLTVLQNVMAPLREHTSLPEDDCVALARLKLSLVGLPPEAGEKYPSELSGGMIKRASLARALSLDPPILFLDEPTAGLDPVAASAFDELTLELNQTLGVTVVIITHDLDTLFSLCHRVAVLVDKKVLVDTLPNLLKSDHPWIKEYFHGPRARAAMDAADRNMQHQQERHGA